MKGIDMSDDFLRVKVQDGDAKLLVMKDGRRWQPPPGLSDFPRDRFSLRRRLFELMKQAIYQARNKMVIMQQLRDKYREDSLYKMGYLMSKTDNACKTFSKVAFRAFRACILGRQWVMYRHRLYEILSTEERVLNLWFTVELLVDLIKKNDNYLKDMLANGTKHPKKEWIFTDS
ncbi:hypothetical protein O3G_MSEX015507 [Manduca sexta]|uniref:Uncharacterized protein n=2 Tax=Manduca sexta TaxID=7130 RepID=A0A921ZY27_MANSE|nr:hypothetical protein O3G_MSEX015507 [Manduca sexta]